MALKNYKEYVLEDTKPSAFYTFEPPEKYVLDLGYLEQDFSGNGHHIKGDSYVDNYTRESKGNPIVGRALYQVASVIRSAFVVCPESW